MKNERILALLQRAQETSLYSERREILLQFSGALAEKNKRKLGYPEQKMCLGCLADALNSLYWGCLNKCPEKLLSFFPVFMMLCGELPSQDSLSRLSRIDWKLFLDGSDPAD